MTMKTKSVRRTINGKSTVPRQALQSTTYSRMRDSNSCLSGSPIKGGAILTTTEETLNSTRKESKLCGGNSKLRINERRFDQITEIKKKSFTGNFVFRRTLCSSES